MSTQLIKPKYSGDTSPQDSSVPKSLEFPDIPHVDDVPFDLNEIRALDQTDFIDFFVQHVLIVLKEAHTLERRIVLQGECAEWLDHITTDSLRPILVKFISEFKRHQKLC